MSKQMTLRDYILILAHRWYLIIAFFLAGALLGWGVSFLWPAPYRAHLDLYVGLNAYRSPRERYAVGVAQDEFDNLDDYKNWQMEQLNMLARQDPFMGETLERLQSQDEYWQGVTLDDLRVMFRGSWRNVGRWHLVAEAPDAQLAAQAVDTWGLVIDQRANEGILHARQAVALDTNLLALAENIIDLETRQHTLSLVQQNLQDVELELENNSSNEPLDALTRWSLLAQASQAAGWSVGWQAVLDDFPASEALPDEYAPWIERVLALIAADLENIPGQIDLLHEQQASLGEQYIAEAHQSLALSATMSLEKSDDIAPRIEAIRPVGMLMLVGGFFGVLVWLVWGLARITREGER